MMNSFFNNLGMLELPILDFIREYLTNPFFDAVLPFFSFICDHGEVWILAALLMLVFPKTRKTGFVVAVALLMGLLLGNLVMKPFFARVRPFDLKEVALIVKTPHDFSFPSGHTLASFEAAFAMMLTKNKVTPYAFALAGIIAFSRLYLYVHFPTDVATSVLLGFAFAYVSCKIVCGIYNSLQKNK